MAEGLRLDRDGADWPNREASRTVRAGGLTWHVQAAGQGPAVLLVHGTGASTHSWGGLLPLLAPRASVVAMDLPGHGFTSQPTFDDLSLPGMALALGRLVKALEAAPEVVVGHSAGAAILARMALDGLIRPRVIVSLNGALMPFGGIAGRIFSPIAQFLAWNPLVPRLFARTARDPANVDRLMADTGSRLEGPQLAFYRRLFRDKDHVGATLGMMAKWDLRSLVRDLPRLPCDLLLVVGNHDRMVSPDSARDVQALVPRARILRLPGLGHLAHEERPDLVAPPILALLDPTTGGP